MNYRQLGTSDLSISIIGFGCMSLKENSSDNRLILQQAFDSGINFFDTADLYDKGKNEELVGAALKSIRPKLILASKVGNKWKEDGTGWNWNPRKEYILQAVEKSLKRLQTDYIDLYQLHGGTIEDPIDETIEAFELLKQQGKIRHYGISSIRPNVIREYVSRSKISSVMMQYSMLDRRPEETCLPLLQQNNIGVLVRGSIAQGLLIDKAPKAYLNYSDEDVNKASITLQKVLNTGRTAAQATLKFVLQEPSVTAAIVGIRTKNQLEEVIKTTAVADLTIEELNALKSALPVNYYDQHR